MCTRMQTNLTALSDLAKTYADPFFEQSNTTAIFTDSCTYYDPIMQGRMNATCPCFTQGLELTDAIMQLEFKLGDYEHAQAFTFETWSWNDAARSDAFCNEDYYYKENNEKICNEDYGYEDYGFSNCEDAVASFYSC